MLCFVSMIGLDHASPLKQLRRVLRDDGAHRVVTKNGAIEGDVDCS